MSCCSNMYASVLEVFDSKTSVSTVMLSVNGQESSYTYYEVTVYDESGARRRTFLLSYDLTLKLSKRYVTCSAHKSTTATSILQNCEMRGYKLEKMSCMPGKGCKSVLKSLHALKRKHAKNDVEKNYVATSSIKFSRHAEKDLSQPIRREELFALRHRTMTCSQARSLRISASNSFLRLPSRNLFLVLVFSPSTNLTKRSNFHF